MEKENAKVNYRLLEMLRGNVKFQLKNNELKRISKKDMIETILEYTSLKQSK